jgi:uncharacterized protein DUF4157
MFALPISKPVNKSASSDVALHSRAVPFARRHSGFEYAPPVQPLVNDGPLRTGTDSVPAHGSAGEGLRDHSWNLCGIPASDPRRSTPELEVGAVDDPLEHEAERVAGDVMRMPAGELTLSSAPQNISRKSAAGEEEEKPQREASGQQAATGEVPAIVHEVLRSPGQPLDPATRAYFEPRLGHDLASVRLHADERAAQSADSIHAQAYTAGHDIVFGKGQFAQSERGQRLLAHELTHVLQQRGKTPIVRRAPAAAPAGRPAKPAAKGSSNSFNSYADLFNGFQDLAAAAINRGGAGLDSTHFGGDLSVSHRALLSRVRAVLIQAQEKAKEKRSAAAAAWPALAASLQKAVTEATRLHLSGEVLAAVTDDIAMLGRKYVHARAGIGEPEVESFEDYADAVNGMNDLLWIFGQMNEAGEGLIREEVPNRKEVVISSAVLESNAKQRASLEKVEFGNRLNARHAKVLKTLRSALLLARSEAPGSAYKALTLWRSIHGDLQHVLARAPVYQLEVDVNGIQREVDSAARVLESHYAAVHQENVGVALTKPRSQEEVKAERATAKAVGPAMAAGMKEAHAVEDFRYALDIIQNHLTPSTDRPGEWILKSGDTVIRVRTDQVQALHATVTKELKTYMAQLVKAMVRVWETYDSIQRGNSTFKLAVLSGWGGATDPGDQSHFKDSLIRVRDKTVYPLVDQQKYVEALKWIMVQKGVVEQQAKEVGDYDSDLDLGYSRLSIAANVVQVALVSLVPVAGEAAIAGGAGVWAVGGTAVAAGGVGAGAAETGRQLAAGEDLDPRKIGKATYSGALIGGSAVAPAATKSLGKFIAAGQEGTAAVGANALAAGTIGAGQSKLGGGSALEGFAGGFFGSIGGSATSQALGPLAENKVANTVIAAGVGAGTAELTGGDPLAGAAGGVSGALASTTVPHTGGSETPGRPAADKTAVAGEITVASTEPTPPALAEPIERVYGPEPAGRVTEPEQAPAQAGSQMVPRRSDYTPSSEESFGGSASRARPGRARPFYAKDPERRPGGRQPSRAKASAAKRRTPAAELADFKKMLVEEFGAKGRITSDKLLRLFRYGSRPTVIKYLKQYLMKEAQTETVLSLGEFELKLKPNVSVERQIDDFLKNLEGAHFTPQAFGKKLPEDVTKSLPGGEYDPNDALVVFTEKPTHTAMDQPWKDAFNKLRLGRNNEATGQWVFDEVADGIRKTPGMTDSEKASRIARLHDEMFTELGLVPSRKYPVPYIMRWWEILAAKAKAKLGSP